MTKSAYPIKSKFISNSADGVKSQVTIALSSMPSSNRTNSMMSPESTIKSHDSGFIIVKRDFSTLFSDLKTIANLQEKSNDSTIISPAKKEE